MSGRRNSLEPALEYRSGAGNSPFSVGCSLAGESLDNRRRLTHGDGRTAVSGTGSSHDRGARRRRAKPVPRDRGSGAVGPDLAANAASGRGRKAPHDGSALERPTRSGASARANRSIAALRWDRPDRRRGVPPVAPRPRTRIHGDVAAIAILREYYRVGIGTNVTDAQMQGASFQATHPCSAMFVSHKRPALRPGLSAGHPLPSQLCGQRTPGLRGRVVDEGSKR